MTILAKRIDDMIKSHNTDNAVVSALLYGNPNYELTTNDYPNILDKKAKMLHDKIKEVIYK